VTEHINIYISENCSAAAAYNISNVILLCQHTWFESLRQKLKDNRRNLVDDDQVHQMKAKYGGRCQFRRKADPLELNETPRAKTTRVSDFVFLVIIIVRHAPF